MTTDESILQEMLDRATNPNNENIDEMSKQMFCIVVKSKVELIAKAEEMILNKIRSKNVTESTRAIALLEECMSKCGDDFQDEIAKNRFLNNLISLVLDKYQGATTPTPVKSRIMECLLLWTTEYPQRSKIRIVYDMLSKACDIEHGNKSSTTVPKRESILGIDEDMLAQLIKSGDPENFKRANLLIQYRVSQESRRTELLLQHKSELKEVQTTVGLLNQMLDTYETDGTIEEGSETMNLIRELYMACKKHKRANAIKLNLPELVENSDEQLMADTLETNDIIRDVLERYKNVVVHAANKTESGTDAATPITTAATTALTNKSNENLLNDLLEVLPSSIPANNSKTTENNAIFDTLMTANTNVKHQTNANTLDELRDIFGEAAKTEEQSNNKNLNEMFGDMNILEPVNIFSSATEQGDSTDETKQKDEGKGSYRSLPQIDQLSEELFKQTMPTSDKRLGSFKKEPEKVTLNDLSKEKLNIKPVEIVKAINQNKVATTKSTNGTELPTNIETKSEVTLAEAAKSANEHEDDVMLTAESDTHELPTVTAAAIITKAELPFKHLSEITIDLDDITATTEKRQLMTDDDDIEITLNFTEEHPSKNVSVIVITALNKSTFPVKDFQFEASVRKPCKVRLLAPTDRAMPAHKPFRPAIPINQVLLLSNPTGKSMDITCIVGYKLGDDPDPIRESIVAKGIPYVD